MREPFCGSRCRCCGRAWCPPGLLAFISSFDELVVALFLAGAGGDALPKKMFDNILMEIDPTIAAV